jgi:hypothetical protein
MVWYGMVWYGMVWYGMVWYGMVWAQDKKKQDNMVTQSKYNFFISNHLNYQLSNISTIILTLNYLRKDVFFI